MSPWLPMLFPGASFSWAASPRWGGRGTSHVERRAPDGRGRQDRWRAPLLRARTKERTSLLPGAVGGAFFAEVFEDAPERDRADPIGQWIGVIPLIDDVEPVELQVGESDTH